MKKLSLATILAAGLFTLTAQDRGRDSQSHNRFDEKDRQAATDWYGQHKDHPPAGFRNQDRLSPDQESRLHDGATLDHDMRGRVHNAPSDLTQRLPPPPQGHRYVTIGGHVGLIDHNYQVKDVIHLHDDHHEDRH